MKHMLTYFLMHDPYETHIDIGCDFTFLLLLFVLLQHLTSNSLFVVVVVFFVIILYSFSMFKKKNLLYQCTSDSPGPWLFLFVFCGLFCVCAASSFHLVGKTVESDPCHCAVRLVQWRSMQLRRRRRTLCGTSSPSCRLAWTPTTSPTGRLPSRPCTKSSKNMAEVCLSLSY